MRMNPLLENYENLKAKIKDYEHQKQLELSMYLEELNDIRYKSDFKDKYKGNIFNSTSSGRFRVLEYFSYDYILIEFLSSGYRTLVRANNVDKGFVKDPYAASVFGVGFIGVGPYNISTSYFDKMIYRRWTEILKRCYVMNEGKYMNPEWFNFQYFAAWFYSEFYLIPGAKMYDMCVDKDILYPMNLEYSPYKCLIIPNDINSKIQLKEYSREHIELLKAGKLNVYEEKRIYMHKEYRESIVRKLAEEYKMVIPYHVYLALKNYKWF